MSNLSIVQMFAGLALTALVGASVHGQTPQQPEPQYSAELKVGDKAPDFTLPGSDGKTHSLADYKGKTVVLAWFPKAFTGG
jgi:cytochrome oxidase Cu insertion factor (SCO1/SenC/PrrC family)